MKAIKYTIILLLPILLASCGKALEVNDLITGLEVSSTRILAGGESKVEVRAKVNRNADAERRVV